VAAAGVGRNGINTVIKPTRSSETSGSAVVLN